MHAKLAGNRSNMMNEAEIFEREELRIWSWKDVKIWEGEASSLLPALNFCLDLGSPQQVCFLRGGSSLLLDRHIHIWASAIVFGAVSAGISK
jgi:hypothetical protein